MRKSRKLPLEQLAPYVYEPTEVVFPATPPRLDWHAIYANHDPVEIEVGFGKGAFLLREALRRPQVNYFGLEIERKYTLYTANRLAIRQLRHVRVCCADAGGFLHQRVADACVHTVHIYFPDPWWKRRHRKRRVFTPAFVATCQRILVDDGQLSIATDVEEYYHVMLDILTTFGTFTPLPVPPTIPGTDPNDPLTNFERKARVQGRSIHRARFARQPRVLPGVLPCASRCSSADLSSGLG